MFPFMKNEKTLSRFAKVYGSPGQGPRTFGPLRVFWPLIPICIIAGWLLHAALPTPCLSTSQAGVLFVLLATLLALFPSWSAKRLNSFLKGAQGEETVARILSFLPSNHTVFNDLQLDAGGPAFDHIVVAPAGVFVIETKNWSGEITFQNGQVLCNGKNPSRSPINQVKEETVALITHLSRSGCPDAPVHPVVCFVGNQSQGGVANIGGVIICTETDLHALFENTIETPLPTGSMGIISSELARCMNDE
ncbi:MAG: NERD domain-containing protein [Kiritimatiellaceae bacterium]|nr:NERD domain-containing protein [Kiritimatiellaceae bacterium]